MNEAVLKHFNHLELSPGADMATVRKAYKDLTFIWHPDRHPAHLKERAQEKLQFLNEAYQFFNQFPEALTFIDEDNQDDFFNSINKKGKLQDSYDVKIVKQQCHRCHGTGQIATDVDWKGSFVNEKCDICNGSGAVLVDPRHHCQDCDGEGLNPNVDHDKRQDWIESKIKTLDWWKKNLKPVEYKKLWLKFHYDHLICGTCRGSGFALYRPDFRQKERRKECGTDYLHNIHHEDKRKNDRRKTKVS